MSFISGTYFYLKIYFDNYELTDDIIIFAVSFGNLNYGIIYSKLNITS